MPIWRADSKEIFYLGIDERTWAIPADLPRAHFGAAVPLFHVRVPSLVAHSRVLAVTRDGKRILFAQAIDQPESKLIIIAADWTKDTEYQLQRL